MKVLLAVLVASCALVHATEFTFEDDEEIDTLIPPPDDEMVSLLEEESTLQGTRQCTWVGDLHVRSTLIDGGNNHNYNVMGEEEWIFARSKLHNDGKPWFELQGTQLTWQREMHGGQFYCKRRFPHITIGKDQAIKCGDFYMVFQAVKGTWNSGACPHDPEIAPNVDYNRFFVKGQVDNMGNYDFDNVRFDAHRWYHFNNNQARMYMHHYNCRDGCGKDANKGVAFDFYCGTGSNEVKVATRGNACCRGALYVNTYLTVPDTSNRNGLVSDGTMTGGLCGGYDTSTADGRTFRDALNACKDWRTTAQTYYYISNSRGQPGHQGVNPVNGHMRGTSTFYTTHPCRAKFIARDTSSIFRMFEMGSKGKNPSYDSARWGGDGKSEYEGDIYAEDAEKKTKAKQDCTTYRKSLDNRDLEDLKSDDAKDVLLRTSWDQCWEDEYLDVPWSNEAMQETFCQSVQGLIDQERKDMYCAYDGYKKSQFSSQDISTCGSKNLAAITRLEDKADVVTGYMEEISTSQGAINYWDDGTCSIEATDFEEDNLDCGNHVFHNSLLLKDGKVVVPGQDDH